MNDTLSQIWDIEPSAYPETESFAAQAAFLLRYATLAPSGHNTQPWLFRIGDGWIDVIADRSRGLPVVDPHDRELAISCGAAIAMLDVAADRFAWQVEVDVSPDPQDRDTLARLTFQRTDPPDTQGKPLFDAILKRRTVRTAFDAESARPEVIAAWKLHAEGLGVTLDIFTNAEKRRAIADLVDQGDHLQFDDPAFRRELATWVHSTRMGSRDGMSGTGFGMPDILAPVARFVMRTFDIGDGVAASDVRKIVTGTPMLALLSSATDTQEDWVQTGRALGQVLLELTVNGFSASYLNQPIETLGLRPKLKSVAEVSGSPQILLRVGKTGVDQAPTVRRDVADVII